MAMARWAPVASAKWSVGFGLVAGLKRLGLLRLGRERETGDVMPWVIAALRGSRYSAAFAAWRRAPRDSLNQLNWLPSPLLPSLRSKFPYCGGSGRSPAAKRDLVNFRLKISPLVAPILLIFLRINWPQRMYCVLYFTLRLAEKWSGWNRTNRTGGYAPEYQQSLGAFHEMKYQTWGRNTVWEGGEHVPQVSQWHDASVSKALTDVQFHEVVVGNAS